MCFNSPIINNLIRKNFKVSSLKLCHLRQIITMYKNFALEIQKCFLFFLELMKLTIINLLHIFLIHLNRFYHSHCYQKKILKLNWCQVRSRKIQTQTFLKKRSENPTHLNITFQIHFICNVRWNSKSTLFLKKTNILYNE